MQLDLLETKLHTDRVVEMTNRKGQVVIRTLLIGIIILALCLFTLSYVSAHVTSRRTSLSEFARAPEESPNTTLHDETGQKITNSVRKWPLYHQKSPLKLTVNQVCARYIGPDSVTRIKLKRNRLYHNVSR